jgi:hypothetical protein
MLEMAFSGLFLRTNPQKGYQCLGQGHPSDLDIYLELLLKEEIVDTVWMFWSRASLPCRVVPTPRHSSSLLLDIRLYQWSYKDDVSSRIIPEFSRNLPMALTQRVSVTKDSQVLSTCLPVCLVNGDEPFDMYTLKEGGVEC